MRYTSWIKPKFYKGITVDLANKTRYILDKDEYLIIESNCIEIIDDVTGYVTSIPTIQVLAIHYTKRK